MRQGSKKGLSPQIRANFSKPKKLHVSRALSATLLRLPLKVSTPSCIANETISSSSEQDEVATIMWSPPSINFALSITRPSKGLPNMSIRALPGSRLEPKREKIIIPTLRIFS